MSALGVVVATDAVATIEAVAATVPGTSAGLGNVAIVAVVVTADDAVADTADADAADAAAAAAAFWA